MTEETRPTRKLDWKKNIVMYLKDINLYLIIIMITFLLVFRIVVVSGTSMNMTLMDGDYLLLVNNMFYRNPEPGDVIVASKESYDDGVPIVKRVIATEGQTVDIINGIVFVDGKAVEEDYLTPGLSTHSSGGVVFPVTVPNGCVFVLGDNRSNSRDSRYPDIGMIDEREILGKAFLVILPGTNRDTVERDFSRLGAID